MHGSKDYLCSSLLVLLLTAASPNLHLDKTYKTHRRVENQG